MKTDLRMISDSQEDLESLKKSYLRDHGWEETCNVPGSFWMWRRDFSDLDKARADWYEAHIRSLPPGRSPASKPVPYGIITAPLDLAVSITAAALEKSE